jgi:hypothetical protein
LDQPEFLYWMNLTGADININMQITLNFTDGTNIKFTYSPQLAKAWNKYYIAVGYGQLNMVSRIPGGKILQYYSARVISAAGGYLSALYTYTFDRYREFPRYFIYRNSLGGFQTLYTWGLGQPEADRTKEDVILQVPYNQAAINGRFYENNIRLQHKNTVYTGYRSLRDIRLLNDFFISQEKYLVSDGSLIPVGISTDNLKQPQDGTNVNGASFVYNPLYDEVVYTDDITQPDNTNTSSGSSGAPVAYNAIVDDDDNDNNPFYTEL